MKSRKNTMESPIVFRYKFGLFILLSIFLAGCADIEPEVFVNPNPVEPTEKRIYELNLRVHLMRDITMTHSSGLSMDSWVSVTDVSDIIMPEINAIYEQADIRWVIDSIIEEDVVKGANYEASIAFIANTARDAEGRSDPARLPHLYSLMQPQHISTTEERTANLYHIYLFPFIGNTSQGNAMRDFNFHSVVGIWTNKHNGGDTPEHTLLVENRNQFVRGSLSRTISHEIGHVLGLNHNECANGCLMGGTNSDGYTMTSTQISQARLSASDRL